MGRVPYARVTSTLKGSNEHMVRYEEVRREKVHGPPSTMCAAAGTGNHGQILGSGTSIKQWLIPRHVKIKDI